MYNFSGPWKTLLAEALPDLQDVEEQRGNRLLSQLTTREYVVIINVFFKLISYTFQFWTFDAMFLCIFKFHAQWAHFVILGEGFYIELDIFYCLGP